MIELIKTDKKEFYRDKNSKSLINIDDDSYEFAIKQKKMVLKEKTNFTERLSKIENNMHNLNKKIDKILLFLNEKKWDHI